MSGSCPCSPFPLPWHNAQMHLPARSSLNCSFVSRRYPFISQSQRQRRLGMQDSLAEWSKALAQGASPQGRGFEPHSCHIVAFLPMSRGLQQADKGHVWADSEKPPTFAARAGGNTVGSR